MSFNNDTDSYMESDQNDTIDLDDSDDSDSNISLSNDLKFQPFKVITSDDVVNKMNAEIKDVSVVLHVPPTVTRIILDRYNWHTQSLMEKFVGFETDQDQDAFFRDARVLNPRNYNHGGRDTVADCGICYDKREITGLQCGHKFCRECWRRYLTMKIMDDGEQTIPCAESKCSIIVDDEIVKSFVVDTDVLSKYKRLICNSFVKWKKNLHWCKSPGCNYVIDSYSCLFVTCKCGCRFCCDCYEEVHAPISCLLLKKWKCDDSATESYLAVNTKACPQCHADIEKNGGCTHMTCQNCKHEFCWKCLKSWKLHDSSFKCNTIEEDPEMRKNRSIVERLKYCWNRYIYNNQALKDEIHRFDVIWEEYEHRFQLKRARDVIIESRKFLMYSYAFIYYLKENNGVYILEHALDDLEVKIDKLSVKLEDYVRCKESDDDFKTKEGDIRNYIVDTYAFCDLLRQKWLNEMQQGHDNGSWEYREDYGILAE